MDYTVEVLGNLTLRGSLHSISNVSLYCTLHCISTVLYSPLYLYCTVLSTVSLYYISLPYLSIVSLHCISLLIISPLYLFSFDTILVTQLIPLLDCILNDSKPLQSPGIWSPLPGKEQLKACIIHLVLKTNSLHRETIFTCVSRVCVC